MKRYTQLTLNERENLFNMRNQNYTFLEIGKILGRRGSTISREYKRNLHSSSECVTTTIITVGDNYNYRF